MQRFTKIRNKVMWDLISALKAETSGSIEVLHSVPNHIPGQPMEFVHRISGPAYIEPNWGYIITDSGRLMMEPLSTTVKFGNRPWKFGIPSPAEHFRAINNGSSVILRFPTVISLRFLWEWNYFHFYNDVLGKLSLLDTIGIDPEIPVVLGKYGNQLPFVQQIIGQGKFRERNWIIEDNAYILAENIIYGTQQYDLRSKYDYILSQIQPPDALPDAEERIFLTRKMRSISNLDAIESMLRRYGFRTVDTSELTIEQQMNIFARTRFLVGIHGAGLTNIIFRRGCRLDMIELHSDAWHDDCFNAIANAYDFTWDHLAGPGAAGDPQHANFSIPIEQLEEMVVKMLDSGNVPIRL